MRQRITIPAAAVATLAREIDRPRRKSSPLVIEGDFGIEVEDAADYVRVQYVGGPSYMHYTYSDPSGALEVGDLVEVDAAGSVTLATVVDHGRGPYKGPVKPVVARIEREVLA